MRSNPNPSANPESAGNHESGDNPNSIQNERPHASNSRKLQVSGPLHETPIKEKMNEQGPLREPNGDKQAKKDRSSHPIGPFVLKAQGQQKPSPAEQSAGNEPDPRSRQPDQPNVPRRLEEICENTCRNRVAEKLNSGKCSKPHWSGTGRHADSPFRLSSASHGFSRG